MIIQHTSTLISFFLCRVQCGPLSEFSDRKHQCTLCGVKIVWHAQNIGQHLNSAHKISLKEYYYTYIKGQPIAATTPNALSIKPHSKFYTFIFSPKVLIVFKGIIILKGRIENFELIDV